jgi:hypothetical protein
MISANPLRAGDWVEIRSKEEILSTLDASGKLDDLPFMPEMFAFCGQRVRVFKRAHKTCDTVNQTGGRRMERTVHLEGLRCSGRAHGGCDAACLIFWKEAWLRPAGSQDLTPGAAAPGCTEAAVNEACLKPGVPSGEPRYSCQATELPAATKPLAWWDVRQYIEDYTSGNERPARMLRGALYVAYFNVIRLGRRVGARQKLIDFYDWFQKKRGGVPFPRKTGTIPAGTKTPIRSLNLVPGENARVRSYEEILQTLDTNSKNTGLYFDAEAVPYCGRTYPVRSRVTRIVDEKTGKMIPVKGNTVILENVWCRSCYSDRRMFCPRAIYSFWRETWLERAGTEGATTEPSSD